MHVRKQSIGRERLACSFATDKSEHPVGSRRKLPTQAFIALDRQGCFTFISPEAEALLQHSRKELLKKPIQPGMFAMGLGDKCDHELQRAIAEQVAVEFDVAIGSSCSWFRVQAYPTAEGLSIYFRQISDENQNQFSGSQAEASCQNDQRLLQRLIDMTPGILYLYDLVEQRNVYVNRRMTDLLGYTTAQIQAMGAGLSAQLVHPQDQVQSSNHIQQLQALTDGKFLEREYRMRHINGEWRWFTGRDSIFSRTAEGSPKLILGTAYDITEYKRIEKALRSEKERFELAAAAVNCLIYDWSIETNRVERTEGLTHIFGYSADEAEPTRDWWTARIHPDDLPEVHDQVVACLATRDRYQVEYRVQTKQGQYLPVLDQGVVLRDTSGQPVRVVGTTTDISDRKRAEIERNQLLADMQRLYQAEQLARTQAEVANRIKDEFLAVLSHELRTPLNPILGWAKLLRSRKLEPQAFDRALETIERNARLQTQLIEDLLDVSRILQGKMSLNVCPVDLVASIKAALETVQLAAEAKAIQIQMILEPNVGLVVGDANRLQQVVWNLLSNAVKFTPQGGRVEIKLERIGSYAQIRVTDTGKGIDPEFLPYIFDYFRQEESALTRRFGGLGLGLAIVRHLVELHGGIVQAASPGDGKGATFVVRLPLQRTSNGYSNDLKANAALMPPFGSQSAAYSSELPLTGVRVLMVDDDPDSQELTAFVLEQAGATVALARSGSEAMERLRQSEIDVLVSDIGMPEMNGYQLMQQVKQWSANQIHPIPAIALTAYAGEFNQQQALLAGFQTHLAKPIDPAELVAVVVDVLKRQDEESQDSATPEQGHA